MLNHPSARKPQHAARKKAHFGPISLLPRELASLHERVLAPTLSSDICTSPITLRRSLCLTALKDARLLVKVALVTKD